MKAVTPVIDLMEKNPWLLKYVHLGMHAGAEIALQDMAQGKGAQQSMEEGATAAVGAPIVSGLGNLVKAGGTKLIESLNAPSKAVQGAEEYAGHVQGTIKPTLESLNAAAGGDTQLQLPAKTGLYEFELKGTPTQENKTGQLIQSANKFDPASSRVPEGGTPGPQNKQQLGSTASTVPDRNAPKRAGVHQRNRGRAWRNSEWWGNA